MSISCVPETVLGANGSYEQYKVLHELTVIIYVAVYVYEHWFSPHRTGIMKNMLTLRGYI